MEIDPDAFDHPDDSADDIRLEIDNPGPYPKVSREREAGASGSGGSSWIGRQPPCTTSVVDAAPSQC